MHDADASTTQLVLKMPVEQIVPIGEWATENKSTLFGYVAKRVGAKLNLIALDLSTPKSCRHVRISMTMAISEALKLHHEARKKKVGRR